MKTVTSRDVPDLVRGAIKRKAPFLLTRFGHCESRLLNYETGSDRAEVNRSLNLQLGQYDFSDEQVLQMAEGVRNAFRHSDVLGTHVPEGFKTIRPQLDALLRNIKAVADKRDLWPQDYQLCSPRIHLDLIRDGAIDAMFRQADDILLVSCRDLAPALERKYRKPFRQIRVPQEARTRDIALETRDMAHFPGAFKLIRDEIRDLAVPGQLVLCGAGFLGKTYCLDAFRQGAVVVDIGSVFDILAGIHSRTSFDLPEYTRHTVVKQAVKDAPAEGVLPSAPNRRLI
jgi:hypothetical protein